MIRALDFYFIRLLYVRDTFAGSLVRNFIRICAALFVLLASNNDEFFKSEMI